MYKGFILLTLSALTFALATVFAKLVTVGSDISALELVFFRFIFGFIVIASYVFSTKKPVVPNNKKYIIWRGIFNTGAVICFLLGIEYSTVTKANLLNMTYPVFVFLLTPFINRERTSPEFYLYLTITLLGSYLVVVPDTATLTFSSVNKGDIFALMSGLIAGFAITVLRQARKYDSSYLILFYLMGIGTFITGALALPGFIVPSGMMLVYIICYVIVSLLGQVFLTVGYRYINAASGALVSSSRILFALAFGVMIFADPVTSRISIGGVLIILSLFGVSGLWKRYLRR